MTTYNVWYNFLLSVAIASPPNLDFKLDKASIQIGERATLRLSLPLVDASAQPQIYEDFLLENPKLKLLERRVHRTESGIEWTYELTAHQTGNFSIPPVQVRLGANTYSSEALPLEVTTDRPESDTDLRPEFGMMKPPFPWRTLVRSLLLALAGLGILWAVYWAYHRIPWRKARQWKLPSLPARPEDDQAWLRARLKQLEKRLATDSDPAGLVDELTLVLKTFLARRTKTPAAAFTTAEINRHLGARPSVPELLPLLKECDAYKFRAKGAESPAELVASGLARAKAVLL